MMDYKFLKLGAVSVTLSLLQACSIMGVGEEPPECGVDKSGVDCVSAREVFAATDTYQSLEGMTAEEVKIEAAKNDPSSVTKNKGVKGGDVDFERLERSKQNQPLSPEDRARVYGNFQDERLNLPSADPLAVRSTPDILRVTIAPYVDESDNLHMPNQFYVEVEKRKWIIGDKASMNANRITPTAVRALSRSATDSKQSNPNDSGGFGVRSRQPINENDFIPNNTGNVNGLMNKQINKQNSLLPPASATIVK